MFCLIASSSCLCVSGLRVLLCWFPGGCVVFVSWYWCVFGPTSPLVLSGDGLLLEDSGLSLTNVA